MAATTPAKEAAGEGGAQGDWGGKRVAWDPGLGDVSLVLRRAVRNSAPGCGADATAGPDHNIQQVEWVRKPPPERRS